MNKKNGTLMKTHQVNQIFFIQFIKICKGKQVLRLGALKCNFPFFYGNNDMKY